LIDKNERVIIKRGKDRGYEISTHMKNDRFFDDHSIQEWLAKNIESYEKGKTVKLSDEQLKKLLDI
jgi:antitoxin YefM